MSIMEGIAIGVGVSVAAAVSISIVKNIFGNSDFRSALKYFNDRSNELPKRAEAYLKAIEIVLDDSIPFASKYNRKIVVYLNSSLISAISKIYEDSKDPAERHNKSKTIVGVMLQDKLRKSTKSQLILITCLALNFILSSLSLVNFSYVLLSLVSILMLCIHLDQKLIDYRVRNGWYGKNEFEAKEIINFIISHSNKDDFNDSGGLKRVIPLPEVEAEKEGSELAGGATA